MLYCGWSYKNEGEFKVYFVADAYSNLYTKNKSELVPHAIINLASNNRTKIDRKLLIFNDVHVRYLAARLIGYRGEPGMIGIIERHPCESVLAQMTENFLRAANHRPDAQANDWLISGANLENDLPFQRP